MTCLLQISATINRIGPGDRISVDATLRLIAESAIKVIPGASAVIYTLELLMLENFVHQAAMAIYHAHRWTLEGGSAGLVLIVEDDAGWRGILSELLAEAGYQVRLCSSFGEALGYLRGEKYVLAVVDLSWTKPGTWSGRATSWAA